MFLYQIIKEQMLFELVAKANVVWRNIVRTNVVKTNNVRTNVIRTNLVKRNTHIVRATDIIANAF